MIHVTPERITKAQALFARDQSNCSNCVVAISIQEETECNWISVGMTSVRFTKNYQMHVIKLPEIARALIKTFDADGTAEPTEFPLEVNFA